MAKKKALVKAARLHWVAVARAGEVRPGEVKHVEAEGESIALMNLDGAYYALSARCPHQGGPLDQGVLWQGSLECPWHHFRFDPATGANVYPASVYPDDLPQLRADLRSARTFPVEVREGQIYVGVDFDKPS